MRKQLITIFILFVVTLISINCSSSASITESFSRTPDQLFPILKGLLLDEGFVIEEENEVSGILNTGWKKLTRDENNIPDPTIEGRIEIKLSKFNEGTMLIAKTRKRSSLFSDRKDVRNVTYDEVGLFTNDLLYIKWNKKISTLKEKKK
jgi:hypothetical protein